MPSVFTPHKKYGTPKILISSDVREANMILIDEFLKGMKTAEYKK